MLRKSILVGCVLAGVLACDDDPAGVLSRETLQGTYSLTSLSFDPPGSSIPELDVLARLPTVSDPRLTLSSTNNAAQLIYTDPGTNLVRVSTGRYTPTRTGVTLDFQEDPGAANDLFLPDRFTLTFDEATETLTYNQTTASVTLQRFRQLFPEFADDPLADPVPGALRVVFTRRGTAT